MTSHHVLLTIYYLRLTPPHLLQYLDYHLSVCHFLMEESGDDFNESDAWQSGHEDWKNDSQACVVTCVSKCLGEPTSPNGVQYEKSMRVWNMSCG